MLYSILKQLFTAKLCQVTPKEAATRLEQEFDESHMWLSETQIKVWRWIHFDRTLLKFVFEKGFFSRYMKKKAQGGNEQMETIPEDDDEEEDNEMEEDEERAVEEALEEAEFMENVQAATENT